VSCFQIGLLSPTLSAVCQFIADHCEHSSSFPQNQFSLETQIYIGLLQIFTVVQIFVLGPRLILGIREFNAKLVTDSDAATAMTSIAFQERVHVSTSSSV
jgi:hypothetical protein